MVTDVQALDPAPSEELAHRSSSWIEVTLLWRPADNALTVRLVELSSGVEVEFGVRPEQALDAFHHPYAYLRVPPPDSPKLLPA